MQPPKPAILSLLDRPERPVTNVNEGNLACSQQLTSRSSLSTLTRCTDAPLFLLLLQCVSGGFAQNAPTLKLNRDDLTVLGVTIGVNNRAQVEVKLGKAQSFKVGAREGADEAIWYRSALASDDTIVVFHFGALGGWSDVTQISISAGKPAPFRTAKCTPSKGISRDLRFLRGIKLGASCADVREILGPPSYATRGKLSYYVSHDCGSQEPSVGKHESSDSSCEVVDSVEAKFTSSDELIYAAFYHFVDR